MATRAGNEAHEVVWVQDSGDLQVTPPSSTKGRFVRRLGSVEPLGGGVPLYKMRARDTGASFVSWTASDPTAAYPGTPVGSIVDKQIAALIQAGT